MNGARLGVAAAEAAEDFLHQFHEPEIGLCLVVRKRHGGVLQKEQAGVFAARQSQRQIVSLAALLAPAPAGLQRHLRLVKCNRIGEDAVPEPGAQLDLVGIRRGAAVLRPALEPPGPLQQPAHPSCPPLAVKLLGRGQLAQMVRIAAGMGDTLQPGMRAAVIMHGGAGAAALAQAQGGEQAGRAHMHPAQGGAHPQARLIEMLERRPDADCLANGVRQRLHALAGAAAHGGRGAGRQRHAEQVAARLCRALQRNELRVMQAADICAEALAILDRGLDVPRKPRPGAALTGAGRSNTWRRMYESLSCDTPLAPQRPQCSG